MRARFVIALGLAVGACSGRDAGPTVQATATAPVVREARLPRAPGLFAPSFVAFTEPPEADAGAQLSDVDSCASCHPDAAAQWAASAHSFASFGNPIYRANVEHVRATLGKTPSRHCGGCHDLPVMIDGGMTSSAPIAADDLRAHSGVTCRLCHGVQSTSADGNGSYVWDPTPIDAPALDDPASIARHRRQVTTKLDTGLCVGCHRGFLSPDMALPAHLSGIDEPGLWRASAWTGNGTQRIDHVAAMTCIDCHMERVAASSAELGAKHGTLASHRFVGGHTWMAGMRGDAEQLRLTRAKLAGVASIDIAGARTADGAWHLPADGAPIVPGQRIELDVVVRNLLAGHRFPGGVLDVQDTWIEVEVADRRGTRIAASGLAHASDPADEEAHVLRTLVVDAEGRVLDAHELAEFRAQIATHTLAPREAQAIRYVLDVPAGLGADRLPLAVTARLRHRSRSLHLQADTCAQARSPAGQAFLAGARGTRDVTLDPCAPQPITLIAEARVELGRGARAASPRPAWERIYEHGMALTASLVTQQDEARAVLEAALARAPDPLARAMVEVQLGWVAAKQGRIADALASVEAARPVAPRAGVLDAISADAFIRASRWAEAVAPAKACVERAPDNTAAWAVYARVLVAVGDHAGALAAAVRGLALAPRDPELLRAQATALAALGDPRAEAAQHAYTRFRSPDEAPGLRIRCTRRSARCARDRNQVHRVALAPVR